MFVGAILSSLGRVVLKLGFFYQKNAKATKGNWYRNKSRHSHHTSFPAGLDLQEALVGLLLCLGNSCGDTALCLQVSCCGAGSKIAPSREPLPSPNSRSGGLPNFSRVRGAPSTSAAHSVQPCAGPFLWTFPLSSPELLQSLNSPQPSPVSRLRCHVELSSRFPSLAQDPTLPPQQDVSRHLIQSFSLSRTRAPCTQIGVPASPRLTTAQPTAVSSHFSLAMSHHPDLCMSRTMVSKFTTQVSRTAQVSLSHSPNKFPLFSGLTG